MIILPPGYAEFSRPEQVQTRHPSLTTYPSVEIFSKHLPNSHQKNFINSVQNVRHTLGCLERSINKSNEYERKLLHCKGSHRHSHGVSDWWDSEQSEEKSFKCSNTMSSRTGLFQKYLVRVKSINEAYRSPLLDIGFSDNTLPSAFRIQSTPATLFRYEELAKRYRALIQAYDEQCIAVGTRDKRLQEWRERVNSSHAHLTHAHTAVLSVGEKYLVLKNKRKVQKKWYEDQLVGMRQTLHDMMDVTTRARMTFDARLESCMAKECDSDAALLLSEIRKCNLLFLENMQLKTLIEELLPGWVEWKP